MNKISSVFIFFLIQLDVFAQEVTSQESSAFVEDFFEIIYDPEITYRESLPVLRKMVQPSDLQSVKPNEDGEVDIN